MEKQNKLEFDPRLSNNQNYENQVKELPGSVTIVDHVAERISEVKSLCSSIKSLKAEKLLHQKLPNYMRRRAMSHNPLRIPVRYRRIHINQMDKSGPSAKKKRPSRKYRRKPSNLMKEYIRRQRDHVWLETHIWHAKRFHMEKLWGYKIPYSPCDKRYRAAYRAISKHCLVNDISFYGAIEVSGPLEELRSGFSRITSQTCGLSITAKAFVSGSREGVVDVFKIDKFPLDGIGKVRVIWKPENSNDSETRTAWLFAHPIIYKELLEELIILFNLVSENDNVMKVEQNDVDPPEKLKKLKKRKLQLKFVTRNSKFRRNPIYRNTEANVTITELKDTLNRFRLTGPLSNATLKKALKLCESSQDTWFSKWVEDGNNKRAHQSQSEFYQKLPGSPAEVPPQMVLAVNIVDPRTNRPAKRTKAEIMEDSSTQNSFLEIPSNSGHSAIWDRKFRDELIENLMPTQQLCELRNEKGLVPGEMCSFESSLQPLPILLIQRSGNAHIASGWDLIVPSGYGMSVWLSLIYCGAKSGGWQEIEMMENEIYKDLFLPDTIAAQKEARRTELKARERYFKKPPNKRQNYCKLAIASPFATPVQQLVSEWAKDSQDFHVIRERQVLQSLTKSLQGKLDVTKIEIPQNSLVPVSVAMSRSNPGNNAIICLPTKKDLKKFLVHNYQHDNTSILTEPLHKDENEAERKKKRVNHKNILKRLRNQRVRLKRKLQKTADQHVKIQKNDTEKLVEKQYQEMCELWVPSHPKTIRHQCSRETIGYLTTSRFTFSQSNVCGIGYIAAGAFIELIKFFRKYKSKKIFVLVRGINSRHYFTSATLKIREEL